MPAVPVIGYTATMTIAGAALSFPVQIMPPSGTINMVDYSYMGMPTKERKKKPALIDNGSVTIKVHYCEADLRTIWALRTAATATAIVITFPDDTTGTPPTYGFNAWLKGNPKINFEMEAIVDMDVELEIDGAITLT